MKVSPMTTTLLHRASACTYEIIDALVRLTRDACFVTDPLGRIMASNSEAALLYGYPMERFVGMSISELYAPESLPLLAEELHSADGDGLLFTATHVHEDGSSFPVEVAWKRGEAGGEQVLVAHVRDITTRVLAEEEVRDLAYRDPLTRLANRAKFMDDLESAIAHARRHGDILAVAFLDLDDFKPVNDRFGHAAGDHLLVDLSARLQEHMRSTDTVARMGGDEFAIVLPRLSGTEALSATARKLAACVAVPVVVDGVEVSVTASIGIAAFNHTHDDADSLLAKADGAMYDAKRAGVVWSVSGEQMSLGAA
jgi:diguanylate cyclase (GGDEF)-like protein/PAS domain S-box-containing protein